MMKSQVYIVMRFGASALQSPSFSTANVRGKKAHPAFLNKLPSMRSACFLVAVWKGTPMFLAAQQDLLTMSGLLTNLASVCSRKQGAYLTLFLILAAASGKVSRSLHTALETFLGIGGLVLVTTSPVNNQFLKFTYWFRIMLVELNYWKYAVCVSPQAVQRVLSKLRPPLASPPLVLRAALLDWPFELK